jgi:hypothetical protein
MAFSLAWRNFRRMQDLTLGFAALALLADALMAWPVLPGETGLKLAVIVLFPLLYMAAVVACGLLIKPLREFLTRFVWLTYKTGFGQSVISVLLSFAVLIAVAGYTWWVSAGAADGGQYPAGVFSGFGAGIGILIVQSVLTHRLERDPQVRAELEDLEEEA